MLRFLDKARDPFSERINRSLEAKAQRRVSRQLQKKV